MIDIDFLQYQGQLRRKQSEGKLYVFDPIRKKYLVQMPEEMVRQLVLLFLQQAKGFSKNRLAIEKTLKVNELTKRCDLQRLESRSGRRRHVGRCQRIRRNVNLVRTGRTIKW